MRCTFSPPQPRRHVDDGHPRHSVERRFLQDNYRAGTTVERYVPTGQRWYRSDSGLTTMVMALTRPPGTYDGRHRLSD